MPNNLPVTTKRAVEVVRFMLLLGIIGVVLFAAFVLIAIQPAASGTQALNQVVHVAPGMSAGEIAVLLKNEGLIPNAAVFLLLTKIIRAEQHLQAGYYLLNSAMSSLEIIDHLRTGDVATERVVIPEGFEIKQIAGLLAERGLAEKDRFIALAADAKAVFGDNLPLDLPIDSLEGYLFPDTYYFSRGQSEEDLIGQMVNRFVQVVEEELRDLLAGSEFTLHEVATLASIVEREIMVDHERPLVASVYLNRLAVDMPMQADPTVRYVMSEDRARVLYSDLEIESPYNTYRYRGLPPGPIASPGLKSMQAVLNPAQTDYFYFVSRGDGTHQFSRTFDEHVRARQMLGY
ncbi:MAG TPA: endolytic transglycosylase MltG [Firmicutes bacterium]|nr:endolytic transglycosylase MltG [Bacillota bacterium]